MDHRSDTIYKRCFANALKKQGYKVKIAAKPADIIAICPKGKTYYFEVKGTTKTKKIFGSLTIRELRDAIRLRDKFRWVIAHGKPPYQFRILSTAEMMKVSYFPPAPHAYFTLDLTKTRIKTVIRRKALAVRRTLVERMWAFNKELR